MPKPILTCLCFDEKAEEAVDFYLTLFPNSRIVQKTHYGPNAPFPEGQVMSLIFELKGQRYFAFNGGNAFQFTPAISLMAYCDTQAELDELWGKLIDGGEIMACGWLTDKFGVVWQVVPSILEELMDEPERCNRTLDALWQMEKLNIADLQAAAEG